ncbi:hypothetical protein [Paenibacillus sp. Marseille-Q4541]|uniref:hypothetical protein n=1 Tax=Paenibacillus sp. Marseille-Q4541 TaxID=2831522 RepID=UPI001BAA3472|nr:hypothetical protein [Paenibacillus sp. Marseille-Q4541]
MYQEDESVKGSLVKQTFSGGSTSGDGKTALRMLQPAILERVVLGQSEEVGRVLHLMVNEVNYTDLREMELSTDDPLRILISWTFQR